MLYFVHIYAILLLYAVYICYFRTGVSEQDVGTLKMGPKRCSETSVRIYHSRLRKNPKESRSRSHCGGIPKWLKSSLVLPHFIHTQPRSINELLNYSNSEREQKFFFLFLLTKHQKHSFRHRHVRSERTIWMPSSSRSFRFLFWTYLKKPSLRH